MLFLTWKVDSGPQRVYYRATAKQGSRSCVIVRNLKWKSALKTIFFSSFKRTIKQVVGESGCTSLSRDEVTEMGGDPTTAAFASVNAFIVTGSWCY